MGSNGNDNATQSSQKRERVWESKKEYKSKRENVVEGNVVSCFFFCCFAICLLDLLFWIGLFLCCCCSCCYCFALWVRVVYLHLNCCFCRHRHLCRHRFLVFFLLFHVNLLCHSCFLFWYEKSAIKRACGWLSVCTCMYVCVCLCACLWIIY